MATSFTQSCRPRPRRSQWLEVELIGLLAVSSNHTQRSLADRLGVSLGTVNGALRRMSRAGFLVIDGMSGSRAQKFTLTAKGRHRLSQAAPHYVSARTADIERAARLLTDLKAALRAGAVN